MDNISSASLLTEDDTVNTPSAMLTSTDNIPPQHVNDDCKFEGGHTQCMFRTRYRNCKFSKINKDIYKQMAIEKKVKLEPGEVPIDIVPAGNFEHKFKPWHKDHHGFKKFKKARTYISLGMKLDIIKYAQDNSKMRHVEIANMFGVDRTAITKILKRKFEILSRKTRFADASADCDVYNQKVSKIALIERDLNNWLSRLQHNSAVQFSNSVVKSHALHLARIHACVDFIPTDAWLESFFKRFQLFYNIALPQDNHGDKDSETMACVDEISIDDDWHPPSAAEEKVLRAKRERSNKISELMAQKMLLGWKMLASSCRICKTVLLQDREGQNVCVSCDELESDSQKDDPAANPQAERSQLQEHTDFIDAQSSIPTSDSAFNNTTFNNVHENLLQAPAAASLMSASTKNTAGQDPKLFSIDETIDVLVNKLKESTEHLRSSQNIDLNIKLCNLIKATADALVSVKNISLTR